MTFLRIAFLLPLLASVVELPSRGATIDERLHEYGAVVASRLAPDFARAGVAYPPTRLTLVVLKAERRMEVYAAAGSGPEKFIRAYPILAASGGLGPKLREGDGQVPEGVYGVDSLNPNSHYHLALHVDYPNAFDRAKARADGRTRLGGDIMIHGNEVSIGCVAMGDVAAEDLFVLAARTGLPQVRILMCPFDFRLANNYQLDFSTMPPWVKELYDRLSDQLLALPVPQRP
jgi:hypothetical protein